MVANKTNFCLIIGKRQQAPGLEAGLTKSKNDT